MSTLSQLVLLNAGLATILAVVVGVVCRSRFSQHRPALIHTLWLLVLAKLIIPPLIPIPVLADRPQPAGEHGEPRPIEQQIAAAPSSANDSRAVELSLGNSQAGRTDVVIPRSAWRVPWAVLLVTASACGALILIVTSVRQLRRLSQILHRAATGDERLAGLAREAAARMGSPRTPVVCTVPASIVPFLWVRPGGPVIVLPTHLVNRMSDEQNLCILCHELAHYLRRDHWSNLFAFLVTSLFWWHPVAWWARRAMRAAQEVCCDGMVLAVEGTNRRCYAETLFAALDFVQSCQPSHPALVSGFGDTSSLERRFAMIASLKVNPRITWYGLAVAIASVAVMLCVPVRGQSGTQTPGKNEQTRTTQEENSAQNAEPTAAREENDPAKLKIEIERLRAELEKVRGDLAKAHYADAIRQAQKQLGNTKLDKSAPKRAGNNPAFSPDGPDRQPIQKSAPRPDGPQSNPRSQIEKSDDFHPETRQERPARLQAQQEDIQRAQA
jgi:beta-lactamase regulating signal transducer with metallopeptidase domain